MRTVCLIGVISMLICSHSGWVLAEEQVEQWDVVLHGTRYSYYTDDVSKPFKKGKITLTRKGNEVTVAIEGDDDGLFTGFGGANTFGATRLGDSYVDTIAGTVENNVLSGTLISCDQYFGEEAGTTVVKFKSR